MAENLPQSHDPDNPTPDLDRAVAAEHSGRMSNEDHGAFGRAHMDAARAHNADARQLPNAGLQHEHKELARANETEAARHFAASGEPATLANPLGVEEKEEDHGNR
jgi:hypothetical protein